MSTSSTTVQSVGPLRLYSEMDADALSRLKSNGLQRGAGLPYIPFRINAEAVLELALYFESPEDFRRSMAENGRVLIEFQVTEIGFTTFMQRDLLAFKHYFGHTSQVLFIHSGRWYCK